MYKIIQQCEPLPIPGQVGDRTVVPEYPARRPLRESPTGNRKNVRKIPRTVYTIKIFKPTLVKSLLIPIFVLSISFTQEKQIPQPFRAFAVGSKFRVDKAVDYDTFAKWVDSLMQVCETNFTEDGPNLVVFGELFGMVTPLFGEKMEKARNEKTLEAAFTLAAEVLLPRFLYHKISHLWFGISDNRALYLSFTDNLYNPFFQLFHNLAKKYECYIIAGTLSADVKKGSPSLTAWIMGYRNVDYSPISSEVYNIAGFWDPKGDLIGVTKKVNLTPSEQELDFSPGKLSDVEIFKSPFGKVGIAISLDAFREDYVGRLDSLGCQILVQPDANNKPWADFHSKSGIWQPKEWMWSTFGSIQKEYKNIQINICPMIVGNLFDMVFDGQSSITMKSNDFPKDAYIGVDLTQPDPYYLGKYYRGKFLAKADWVMNGATESISDLQKMSESLKPGGENANQYHEEIIWADVQVVLGQLMIKD